MINIDLKSRFRNKAFLMALASAIVLLIKNFGLGQCIPQNIDSIINGFITIGILLGVIVDTSTPGISDQVVSTTTTEDTNIKEAVKTEDSTTSINNEVSEDSQESTEENTNTTKNVKIPR